MGTITGTIVTMALVYGGRHKDLTVSFKRVGRTYNSDYLYVMAENQFIIKLYTVLSTLKKQNTKI